MPGREFLYVTKEATPGVFDDEAAAADKFVIRLDRANAFNALAVPIPWDLRDAAGSNRRVQTGNEQSTASGSLSTILYPTQAAVLVGWACNISGDPLELASTLTLDHMRMMEDSSNTMVLKRYVGCMCQTFRLEANNQGDGVLCRTQYTFVHMGESTITTTDRPVPALSTYPTIKPYVLQDLKGNLILKNAGGSGTRNHFASVAISVNNTVFQFYDEDRFPSRLSWRGRDVEATVRFRLEDLVDRTAMENATDRTMEVLFEAGTTPNAYSLNFDFHDQVKTREVTEDRPLDGGFYQDVTNWGFIDISDGTDLTVTAAGPV